jgi:5-methylcytosine-specific restriction endonuclease McrA
MQDDSIPFQTELPDVSERRCAAPRCGTVLVRQAWDRCEANFRRRKTCSRACRYALMTTTLCGMSPSDRLPDSIRYCNVAGCGVPLVQRPGEQLATFLGRTTCGRGVHKRIDTICEQCGKPFRALAFRIDLGQGRFCSRACYKIARGLTEEEQKQERRCANPNCSAVLAQRGDEEPGRFRKRRTCGGLCQRAILADTLSRKAQDAARARMLARDPQLCNVQSLKRCPGCGEGKPPTAFTKDTHNRDGLKSRCRDCAKVQLRKYLDKHPTYYHEHTARRRALIADVTVGEVSFERVLARDGLVCHICQHAIDPAIRGMNPMGLTFDHVIPLSKGGMHSEGNLRPAHRVCNLRKGAQVLGGDSA